MQPDGVLGHLGVLVPRCQVTQGADGRFCDVFSVSGSQDCANQRLDAANLRGTADHWRRERGGLTGLEFTCCSCVTVQQLLQQRLTWQTIILFL